MEQFAQIFSLVFLLYLAIGILFAIAFVWKGIGKVDEKAKDTHWFFKVLVFPGSIAFWPLLLSKWLKA